MDSLEQNKLYKQEKKIEREIKKREKAEIKRKETLEKKRKETIEKAKAKADADFHKNLAKMYKKSKDMLDAKKRDIRWKKKLKKHEPKPPSWTKLFEKLLVAKQKYSKLSTVDENWYCTCYTCWCIRHRSAMNWWHWSSRTQKSIAHMDEWINSQCSNCNKPESLGWLSWNYVEYKRRYDLDHWEWAYDKMKDMWKKLIDQNIYNIEWIEKEIKRYNKLNKALEAQYPVKKKL